MTLAPAVAASYRVATLPDEVAFLQTAQAGGRPPLRLSHLRGGRRRPSSRRSGQLRPARVLRLPLLALPLDGLEQVLVPVLLHRGSISHTIGRRQLLSSRWVPSFVTTWRLATPLDLITALVRTVQVHDRVLLVPSGHWVTRNTSINNWLSTACTTHPFNLFSSELLTNTCFHFEKNQLQYS